HHAGDVVGLGRQLGDPALEFLGIVRTTGQAMPLGLCLRRKLVRRDGDATMMPPEAKPERVAARLRLICSITCRHRAVATAPSSVGAASTTSASTMSSAAISVVCNAVRVRGVWTRHG